LNQSLSAASLAIENGLGVLFWTGNWKASLLTSPHLISDIQQASPQELEE
jgi:hypothetical protein